MDVSAFRRKLLAWYARHKRDLPWRRTADPYRIWISEIMLQQTRVAAVVPYYERFLVRFPAIQSLAEAPEQDLLAAWAGLGYYTRVRNIQKAARQMNGSGFPREYESIRRLAGVGDYTAAAVASIAFNLPHAVLDGNVLRVLARVTDDSSDIGSLSTRRRLQSVADEFLDPREPASYNQAIMELGATVCVPKSPQCSMCPVAALCSARQKGTQNQLPIKLRRKEPIKISRTLLYIERAGKFLVYQRAGFRELPEPEHVPSAVVKEDLGQFRHSITHRNYTFTVARASIPARARFGEWVAIAAPASPPLSTTARKALHLVQAK